MTSRFSKRKDVPATGQQQRGSPSPERPTDTDLPLLKDDRKGSYGPIPSNFLVSRLTGIPREAPHRNSSQVLMMGRYVIRKRVVPNGTSVTVSICSEHFIG